ncbi:unknown protein (plasmid) [[Synechococcus] sp. NIES-970]|nr:unknown protein [[Synechococcus] sp. NIES-970]
MLESLLKFRLNQFLILAVVSLVLISCTSTRTRNRPDQLDCVDKPVVEQENSIDPFAGVTIDMGIDASGSMVGFVNRSGTLYTQAIDSLSTLIGNRNIPTRYWRIGSSALRNTLGAESITPAQFLEAKFPKFYDCKIADSNYSCVSSTLHQIYELPSNNEPSADVETQEILDTLDSEEKIVTILLTDLEPDQSAIAQLSSRVSQELQKNPDYKAVLVGVRSEFNGNVFSAETGQISIANYSTDTAEVAESGRPFYLVMTGPEIALDAIINSFNNLPLDVSRSFRVTSFAASNTEVLTLDKSAISDPINECLVQRGNIGRDRPDRNQADQWLILGQRRCGEEANTVIDIWSESSSSLVGATIAPEKLISSSPLLKAEAVDVQGDRLKVQAQIITSSSGSRRGEAVYLTLSQRDLDEAVWADWNSTVANPDGSKTQNLLLFVYGLREAVKGMALQNVSLNPEAPPPPNDDAVKFCIGIN